MSIVHCADCDAGHCVAIASCLASRFADTFGGIAFATDRPLPGSCAEMERDISPANLPDAARPLRDRLAGLR